MTKPIRKYLASYAEQEAAFASELRSRYYAAVVVPLHDESSEFLAGYREAARRAPGPILVIAVVNGRDSDSQETHARNRTLLDELCSAGREQRSLCDGGGVLVGHGSLDVLCVDRASAGRRLPEQQGVGLARKLGCDLWLGAWSLEAIEQSRIYCCDADVVLPEDYFVRDSEPSAALCFPFWHRASGHPELDRAVALYETSLRYYVLGLAFARSPYAFHSVGSSLVLDPEAYARVRGFPRKQAGEDFYLLNKLAKQGTVVRPFGAPLEIRSRTSGRVPFGTGAATARIQAQLRDGGVYEVYSPEVFELLGAWIEAVDACVQPGQSPPSATRLRETACSRAAERLGESGSAVLRDTLDALKLAEGLASALASAGPAQAWRRAHEWFDGFRTLKSIHALRDRGCTNLTWMHAYRSARFMPKGIVPECFDATSVEPPHLAPLCGGEPQALEPGAVCAESAERSREKEPLARLRAAMYEAEPRRAGIGRGSSTLGGPARRGRKLEG